MNLIRSSGILLHPTSLPGGHGIGDFGPEAIRFLDWLQSAGQKLWQVLPLNPPGYSESPYQCYSAFAGSPLLISLDRLVEKKLLDPAKLKNAPAFGDDLVDYAAAAAFKMPLLKEAFARFHHGADYNHFCKRHEYWLADFALFMALKDAYGGKPWTEWEPEIVGRQPDALAYARKKLKKEIDFHLFLQYIFFDQLSALRREAASRGVMLVGDIPIFVAHNSADVWAHQDLFHLEPSGEPSHVAGVPPDYFSETGQRWGNPLYDWEEMKMRGYKWWIERLRASTALYDIARIDHFRGFEAFWAIPASEETAVKGQWVKGPGEEFFQAMLDGLGDLPLIAEDLGVITPEVEALRDRFALPGMKVLQFGFSAPENEHLPHNFKSSNCVVYTGTHDNDTTRGWWKTLDKKDQRFARTYLDCKSGSDIVWRLIRLALSTVAAYSIFPVQDILDLDGEARMNLPGSSRGNWDWRMRPRVLDGKTAERLKELTELYYR